MLHLLPIFEMKQIILISFFVQLLFCSCTKNLIDENKNIQQVSNQRTTSFTHSYTQYRGNLVWVLADVKQAQIKNKLTSESQIDNLLDGFEKMGVNGIRITIFADNVNPNTAMFDYLYTEAVKRNLKVFANPALWEGARRIANGVLYDENGGTGPSVLGKTWAKNALVDRIKRFSNQYPCDWISPFNEDGAPGKYWYANQMDNIYSELYGNVNGAELIGPCTWGVPAGTDILNQTNIKQYISIATTHNLGFDHNAWDGFIQASGNLPTWDSETNLNKKYDNKAIRIDAAIDAGVNGLVLYDSWKGVDLSNGELNSTGELFREKVVPFYYIQNYGTSQRLRPLNDQNGATMVVDSNTASDYYCQWSIEKGNEGYFRFKNRATGMYFRPIDNDDFSDLIQRSTFSGVAHHIEWEIEIDADTHLLTNHGSGKRFRAKNKGKDYSNSSSIDDIKVEQAPKAWTGDQTKWTLNPIN